MLKVTEQEQYIEFGIESERYAIRIQDIHEIIKMQDITSVPNVMPYVKGVINLRGKIVPVISLRHLFHLDDKRFSKTTRVIVVHHQEDTVGIIVDRVNKVNTFSDIQPPPARVGSVAGNYFTGIGLTDNGLVGILKLDEVLLHEQE
ncbi:MULTISPECIES: chemotaxis protein CheW [unclassified Paenibacillus]|uniref:chemotaxis protein CheW n=1 Tax=unclassified Paenibacillus TaxID=185978 RepID=UPI001AE4C36D|nr:MULTISPECIES: chemotaxis protein CheW [unclassified Paenibacillus]MBP1154515.1 purine-binding chemotaxis protein CheW [Paenibacillus sp. PvP091]MBP1170101.1 purine-binding chemotaxis protein CheW [Paenibacillus sp. PvR098]MBP2441129.1 purine-binding chemotaxis protein CheW [Paenibacillus sp. PvP052]